MGKEFKEEKLPVEWPCGIHTVVECLTNHARGYISQDKKINNGISEEVRDAILVDAINDLATSCFYCSDLGTYVLQQPGKYVEVDENFLLNVAFTYFPEFLFGQDLVESISANINMNRVEGAFDKEKAIIVIVDFMNYMSASNGFSTRFTVQDLLNKYKEDQHQKDMDNLKTFLQSTQQFTKPISRGEDIETIYSRLLNKHNLKSISNGESYYYNDKARMQSGKKEMDDFHKLEVREDLYALGYAYAKMTGEKETGIKPVDKAILKMKNREI